MDDSHFTVTFPFDTHTATLLGVTIGLLMFIWFVLIRDMKNSDMSRQSRQFDELRRLANRNYIAALVVIMIGLGIWAFVAYLIKIPPIIGTLFAAITDELAKFTSSPDHSADNIRSLAYAYAALAGALALFATIPFQLIKAWTTERATLATETGLITDRISKAVEQLGADKTIKQGTEDVTVPNLEVRIGALFSLERIKNDSLPDHIQVLEILCAYIRENMRQIVQQKGRAEDGSYHQLREDIATCLKIIQRRTPQQVDREKEWGSRNGQGLLVDLSNTTFESHDLSLYNLSFMLLENTDFTFAQCRGTDFQHSQLSGSDFEGANCLMARFDFADCTHTGFNEASLQYARFDETELESAYFDNANLFRSHFMTREFDLEPSFEGCNLHAANFEFTHFEAHSFSDAFVTTSTILPQAMTHRVGLISVRETRYGLDGEWKKWLEER